MQIGTDAADAYVEISFGDSVTMSAEKLRALMSDVGAAAGIEPKKANARFNQISFATGKDYKGFADTMKLDFATMNWTQ